MGEKAADKEHAVEQDKDQSSAAVQELDVLTPTELRGITTWQPGYIRPAKQTHKKT